MAYFYRLVLLGCCLFSLSAPALADIPKVASYTAASGDFIFSAGSALAACSAALAANIAFNNTSPGGATNAPWSGNVVSAEGGNCNSMVYGRYIHDNVYGFPYSPDLACPVNSSSSSSSACSCNVGFNQDIAGSSCTNSPCSSGQSVTSSIDTGWAKKGDLVTVYAAQKALQDSPGCVTVAGSGCTVGFTGSNAAPIGIPGSNGYSSYTVFLKGLTTGDSCTVPPPSPKQPEPPCAGQSGQLDGKTVCLSPESAAAAAARIASAAQAAAQAASIAASNAGATAAAAAAAAQAAGAAMAAQLTAGSTPEAATAAAAAAGAAASAASTAGKTDGQVTSESTGAGSVASAEMRARLIATSSGASAAVIAQAVSSAGAAAAIAAAGVLANGGTQAQAAAAGLIAGQTATASVLVGSSPGAAAAAGAAAGSGAAAGQAAGPGAPNGTGKPDDPVGDFCKTNPQAKMCKTELDGEFAGVCGAPPMCKGDAVLCAVAAATFATNCSLRDPKVATPLYDAALLKTGDQTVALAGNSTVSVNSTQFDQTELLGAAVGMTDRSISVMGSTVVLPFSNVNIWLARLGVVLQAVTFLLCARIVTRG